MQDKWLTRVRPASDHQHDKKTPLDPQDFLKELIVFYSWDVFISASLPISLLAIIVPPQLTS